MAGGVLELACLDAADLNAAEAFNRDVYAANSMAFDPALLRLAVRPLRRRGSRRGQRRLGGAARRRHRRHLPGRAPADGRRGGNSSGRLLPSLVRQAGSGQPGARDPAQGDGGAGFRRRGADHPAGGEHAEGVLPAVSLVRDSAPVRGDGCRTGGGAVLRRGRLRGALPGRLSGARGGFRRFGLDHRAIRGRTRRLVAPVAGRVPGCRRTRRAVHELALCRSPVSALRAHSLRWTGRTGGLCVARRVAARRRNGGVPDVRGARRARGAASDLRRRMAGDGIVPAWRSSISFVPTRSSTRR